MSTSRKSKAKKIARLESKLLTMGALIAELDKKHGVEFGEDLHKRAKLAICDYKNLSAVIKQREAKKIEQAKEVK